MRVLNRYEKIKNTSDCENQRCFFLYVSEIEALRIDYLIRRNIIQQDYRISALSPEKLTDIIGENHLDTAPDTCAHQLGAIQNLYPAAALQA